MKNNEGYLNISHNSYYIREYERCWKVLSLTKKRMIKNHEMYTLCYIFIICSIHLAHSWPSFSNQKLKNTNSGCNRSDCWSIGSSSSSSHDGSNSDGSSSDIRSVCRNSSSSGSGGNDTILSCLRLCVFIIPNVFLYLHNFFPACSTHPHNSVSSKNSCSSSK